MTVTRGNAPPIPAAARRLNLPIWQRGQERMRERYGFDLAAPDAQSRAEALLAAAPGADAHLLLAAVLATRGSNTKALEEARAAVAADDTSARAHTTLATLLMNSGDSAAALDHARRAAMLDPDDAQVIYNLGLAEHVAGEPRTARRAFDRAADLLGMSRRGWRIWRR